jgi:hypothetical protein
MHRQHQAMMLCREHGDKDLCILQINIMWSGLLSPPSVPIGLKFAVNSRVSFEMTKTRKVVAPAVNLIPVNLLTKIPQPLLDT